MILYLSGEHSLDPNVFQSGLLPSPWETLPAHLPHRHLLLLHLSILPLSWVFYYLLSIGLSELLSVLSDWSVSITAWLSPPTSSHLQYLMV